MRTRVHEVGVDHGRLRTPRAARRIAGALLGVMASAGAASAQEAAPVEVRIRPEGEEWSVGDRSGAGACTLHLAPSRYHLTVGETSTDVLIDTPSEVSYRPALPALRNTGIVLIATGVVAGSLLTALALKHCGSTTPMAMTVCNSTSAQDDLGAVLGVSFATAVAGGFMWYFGDASIRVRDLPPPRPRGSFTLGVSGQGASLGWSAAF